MNAFFLMLLCYSLSVINLLMGYFEAIKVCNAEGKVNGRGMIFYIPLGVAFAILSSYFLNSIK
ncbi:hypothetical protein [Bacillus gobiensis]|uniref:hypothetical protein n=1 Tax=Bacillus gobiensis TaxID=1441095 RepID=UPI003D207F64